MAIILAVLSSLFTTIGVAQAKEQAPTTKCLHALKWNRWAYTKVHINVTQSIQQHKPRRVHWSIPTKRNHCAKLLARSKALRLAENAHWNRVRVQRQGIKWIIRRRFSSAGREVVLAAWKIVSCESSFQYNSYNGADSGIWQINWVHHLPKYIMFSPELSTGWAWRASKHGRDFGPWVCAHRLGIA